MAAEVVTSQFLSTLSAVPYKGALSTLGGRSFYRNSGPTITTTGKTSPSYYGLLRIPSRAVVRSVLLTCDALSTSVTADLGVYNLSQPFGPVNATGTGPGQRPIANSSQLWGSGTSLATALSRVQQVYANSSFVTTTNFGQPIWQQLGLASDPNVDYDVVLTSDATITAGGNVILEIEYMMPSS